jgi:NarL family two-component system response regulator LiaR
MCSIQVLLGDDHRIVREITAEVVNHQPDMQVIGQANTGAEVVALARERQPNVVLIDIAMSPLDKLETTRRIVTECPACYVLVCTNPEDEEAWYFTQLLEAGAAGCLPKTVNMDELLGAIRAAARGETILPQTVAPESRATC